MEKTSSEIAYTLTFVRGSQYVRRIAKSSPTSIDFKHSLLLLKSTSSIMTTISARESILTLEQLSLDTPPYVNVDYQPHIPFYAFLRQSSTINHPMSHLQLFKYYSLLPPEIRLMILEMYDAPTLFNLMRTCSDIRIIARPLFWSHPDPWYYANIDWIVGNSCFPEEASLRPDFANQTEQVDLDCGSIMFHRWQCRILDQLSYERLQDDEEALTAKSAQTLWRKYL